VCCFIVWIICCVGAFTCSRCVLLVCAHVSQQMLLSGCFYCHFSSSARVSCAAHGSLCVVKPGRIHSSIMFSRFPPGVLWTVTGNVLSVPLSRPPNSFCPVTWCSFVHCTSLLSVLAVLFCFGSSLLWSLQTFWHNINKSVWVSVSSLFSFSVVCDGTFHVIFWDSCFHHCWFTSGERWWWCCVMRLFVYPAHIASVTCQLLVCFCRNPENDTSLHLLNSPLSCANFTFLSWIWKWWTIFFFLGGGGFAVN